ncbi:MAG TPA: hypothetical protein VGZ25_16320, partial [Gemmataceae bacterium]|nr:hypothetical protein [Gemmataceae bacterium]
MPSLSSSGGRVFISLAVALILVAGIATWLHSAQDPAKPKDSEVEKPARRPWKTSKVVGSPDPPPPFRVIRAFPNVKFEHPLLMARSSGSDRLFVGEQAGVLYSFEDKPDAKPELVFDLRKELKTIHLLPDAKEVEAIYGFTFHPDFE